MLYTTDRDIVYIRPNDGLKKTLRATVVKPANDASDGEVDVRDRWAQASAHLLERLLHG
jgi:hypothetical protein